MTCCVIDSLVDNNLLEQLSLTGGNYQQWFASARQPDVDLAHFIRENWPSFQSRFARQVRDIINGRRDVLPKPPPDPASGYLPACRRWWADRARDRLGRQRRRCLPFLGHLLDGNHRCNRRLNRSCRKKSHSSF